MCEGAEKGSHNRLALVLPGVFPHGSDGALFRTDEQLQFLIETGEAAGVLLLKGCKLGLGGFSQLL